METIFIIALLFILYTYIGYPLLLLLTGRGKASPAPPPAGLEPRVSILIPAYNEGGSIRSRLENVLQFDYPKERLEVVVASDGSEDNTGEIVRSLSGFGVRLVEYAEHRGKMSVINRTVPRLSGEIVVFTDATAAFAPDALRRLVARFADPAVGAVSGELILREERLSRGEVRVDWYWKMEKFLRKRESARFSCLGATGAIYALRRDLFLPLPEPTILDDFLIPLEAVRRGYRIVFEERAKAYETVSADWRVEFRRKVRTLTGNYQAFAFAPWLLIPWKSPIAFSMISHKLLRLFIPFAMIITLIASAAAFTALRWFFFFQVIGYLLAAAGWMRARTRGKPGRILSPCFTFCLLNAAALWAFVGYCFRRVPPAWK